jgi:gluconolactonase
MDRRQLLRGTAAGLAALAAALPGARAEGDPKGTIPPPRNWDDPTTVLYPDPAFEVFDKRFAKYNAGTTSLERIWTGAVWTEGPVWFGDWHSLLFSDIPNNRILRYDVMTRDVTLYRYPSHYANGNTRDRQGRLVSCEQGTRRVTRTEFDGSITVIADSYQGKRLNSPNGVIVKSDDTIWFTDPTYGINGDHEGNRAEAELPRNVYRFDPKRGRLEVVAGDFSMPNGLCFSPDEKKLYVSDTGILGGPAPQHTLIRVFDVTEDGRLTNDRLFHDFKDDGTYIADDMRVDEDGNLWCAGGWGPPEMNGVRVFAPDGTPIGAIWTPEVAGNLCFGGHHKNRLFIAASKSIYAIDVNTRGVEL